jgi:hypothetical protein
MGALVVEVRLTVCPAGGVPPATAENESDDGAIVSDGALPVAVKVAGESPLTVAESVFAPPAGPSVQLPTVAIP